MKCRSLHRDGHSWPCASELGFGRVRFSCFLKLNTVDGSNPEPPRMCCFKTLLNNGINYLSTCAGFLPSVPQYPLKRLRMVSLHDSGHGRKSGDTPMTEEVYILYIKIQ